ncbi:MAG: hypothetical protein GXO02_02685 [Epsilonproteobacteria bacterium]|nr:hypothetical protein [Campylobacterota bacterium]
MKEEYKRVIKKELEEKKGNIDEFRDSIKELYIDMFLKSKRSGESIESFIYDFLDSLYIVLKEANIEPQEIIRELFIEFGEIFLDFSKRDLEDELHNIWLAKSRLKNLIDSQKIDFKLLINSISAFIEDRELKGVKRDFYLQKNILFKKLNRLLKGFIYNSRR